MGKRSSGAGGGRSRASGERAAGAEGRGARAKEQRAAKRAREVAERLTFLEKLVLRALPTRQVPAESGVRFAISSKAKEDGVCLIFLVDDAEAPIVEEGPRPDYLVVHVSPSGCTVTIVEMKGTEEKNIDHGIEQIRAMYRRLRQEMAACLPGSCRRIRVQGVLLMPQNAHINRKRIEDARKEGLEILPVQYHHQAELYPYVSKAVSRTERYVHEKLPRERTELNVLERLIAEGKLDWRVRDRFFEARRGGDEGSFFLSFRRPGDPADAYVSVSANPRGAVVGFSPAARECQEEVEAHLARHGLRCAGLRVQTLDPVATGASASGG